MESFARNVKIASCYYGCHEKVCSDGGDSSLTVVRTNESSISRDHRAGEDITYGDHVIPKDTEVCVWIQALQCHKEFWDKPFKFDPERWEGKVPRGQYMPFLDGTR